ncbi:uncharacterized protein UTRI_10493 [Ustilago trichophora]|uniref:Uncharacterized protein n=1 Tax=Ustilago trichophora TaxID=86804 RepID=A0A5C3ECQ2_9BASI|nr:uncharacterized protein UTRI_10493 [Ustilago trichophora]
MAAVASAPQLALGATPLSTPTSNPTDTQPPPRLLLRLPPEPEIHGRRNPLKRKWRSIVNFFALPIRAYYLEPPGAAYRAELRARRGNPWEDADGQHSFWPVPAYTDEVGDDEMVLFKAQEEAEALAAMQRDQAAAQAERGEQVQGEGSPEFNDTFLDQDEQEEEERLASASMWPQTPPEATSLRAFQSQLVAEPSPRYERTDPLSSAVPLSISNPRTHTRPRTSSNLTPITTEPTFANGIPMSRHLSTPLSPTPSSPPSSSGIFARRNRALTSTVRPNLGGRNISEPLSWTLVRSQYSYPKRGLTPEQLTFLSSVESLGRFGVPHSPSAAAVLPSPAYEAGVGQSDYGFPVSAARD